MKLTKIPLLTFLNLSLIFLFSSSVLACTCYSSLPCEAYSRADQVFIGKLQKIEKNEKSSVAQVYAYFAVERMFKGRFEKEIVVKFETECRDQPFKVGETYFVYDKSGQMNNICNRTSVFYKSLSNDNLDLKYAESLSIDKPQFSILGRLNELSESELQQTRIEIEDGEKSHKMSPAKRGFFEFSSYKQNSFKVKITVPFLTEVFPGYNMGSFPALTTSKLNTQTSVEYNLNFQPNACNYIELVFSKIASTPATNFMITKEQR